jgi:hypothetical protein
MKERYLRLMEKALAAYSADMIDDYFARVQREGLTEHGFARLTADIGVLIAHGRRTDLAPRFLAMMDFCCAAMPHVKAANDFTVREIVTCIMALEEHAAVPPEKLVQWKNGLAQVVPEKTYDVWASYPEQECYNWACFSAASEYMRNRMGLGDSRTGIDTQIATQLQWLDENGMYHETGSPMVYDLVPRALFAVLLHFGYSGPHAAAMETCLEKSIRCDLRMQSVSGEIPYGGRSAQFWHNEAWLAIVFEYAAARCAKRGEHAAAAQYKSRIRRALAHMEAGLDERPIHHNKTRFATETGYGCEGYAYFDKYMITTASILYMACLLCDETAGAGAEPPVQTADVWQTSAWFHKVFAHAGGYTLQFDTAADAHYDCSGLGRVHRAGAPTPLCLSLSCTVNGNYKTDLPDAVPLAIAPGVKTADGWQYATGGETVYTVEELHADAAADAARVRLCCRFPGGQTVETQYTADKTGVSIRVKGSGEIALLLPAFAFYGAVHPEITAAEKTLAVSYRGWACRYTAEKAGIADTARMAANRNGHYRVFAAQGRDELAVRITMEKE